jgi:hypothetical protein
MTDTQALKTLLNRTAAGRAIANKMQALAGEEGQTFGAFLPGLMKRVKKIGKFTSKVTGSVAKIAAGIIGIPPSAINALAKVDPTAHKSLLKTLEKSSAGQQAAAAVKAIEAVTKPTANFFTNIKPIYYVAAPINSGEVKGKLILFGIPFKDASGTEGRSFKAYTIATDGTTKVVAKGWGSTCEFFKEIGQLGQEPLSADQYATLESWLKRNGYAYSVKNPNSEEYKGVLVKDLKNASNGEMALPGYAGEDMVWIHQGLSNIGADQAKNLESMLAKQKFTQDLSNIPMDSDAHDYAFYLSDVIKDLPQLDQVRSLVKNDILIYPLNEILVEPERGVCRSVINKLYDCSTKS